MKLFWAIFAFVMLELYIYNATNSEFLKFVSTMSLILATAVIFCTVIPTKLFKK